MQNTAKTRVIREIVIVVVLAFVTVICFVLGATYNAAFAMLKAPWPRLVADVCFYPLGTLFLIAMYRRLHSKLLEWTQTEKVKTET
ncbi:MAG TPA: hypothetical protein VMT42_07300 [candidate division Zixibacteria bacterium]|nr:hypothetical protein [candidate division Zixibacteria bacterium]